MDGSLCLVIDSKALAFCQIEEDLRQFIGGIVVEMNGLGKAALQARVRIDEVVHLIGIAGHDTDELAPIVFQSLQQRVDGL